MDEDQKQPESQQDQSTEETSMPSSEETVPVTPAQEPQNLEPEDISTSKTSEQQPDSQPAPENTQVDPGATAIQQDVQTVQKQEPLQSPSEPREPVDPNVASLAEKIVPAGTTEDQTTLFQSWLTKYLRSLRSLGTLGLERKRLRHMDKVVDLLGKHGSLTQIELAHMMRLTTVTIGKYAHELIAEGRIRHVGPMHHGRYEKVS